MKKTLIAIFVLVCLSGRVAFAAFPTGWASSCPITIDHTKVGSGGVTGFSAVLTESSLPAALFSGSKSDGSDIRASSDAAGTTQLPCDVVAFSAGGTGTLVVKTDLSSASDTTVYVWWGNASATLPAANSAFGQYNAYNANCLSFFTLTDASGNPVDRTSAGKTLTLANATYGASGQLKGAVQFNGTTTTGSIPYDFSAKNKLVVSAWLYINSYPVADHLTWEFTSNFGSTNGSFMNDPDSTRVAGKAEVDLKGDTISSSMWSQPSAAAWHQWDCVYDMTLASAEVSLYVDGAASVVSSRPNDNNNTGQFFANDTLYLMSRASSSLRTAGRIQWLSIWTSRSAAEVTTHYNQISAPASFASVSTPAAPSSLSATTAGASRINISFTANDSGTATSYTLQWDIVNTFTSPSSQTVNQGVTTAAVTNLSPLTTYYFRVRANNGAGSSSYSNTASATTLAAGGGPNRLGIDLGIGLETAANSDVFGRLGFKTTSPKGAN